MLPEYARLTVKILNVQLERQSEYDFKTDGCTIRLSLGHQRYRHTIHEMPCTTSFSFSLTLHAHLFFILQADCFAVRRHQNTGQRLVNKMIKMATLTKSREHVGRAQLRVRLLEEVEESFDGEDLPVKRMVGWWELRPKRDCFLPLDELGKLPDDPRGHEAVGAIRLQLEWTKQPTVSTLIAPVMAVEAINRVAQAEAMVKGGQPWMDEDQLDDTKTSTSSDLSGVDTPLQVEGTEDIERAVAAIKINDNNHTTPQPLSGTAAVFQRMASAFMNAEDHKALLTIQALLLAFNQGIEVGGVAMTRAFILLQRYYRSRPKHYKPSTTRCMLKRDFVLPRQLFKFVIASFGWMGVTFVGKGKGLMDGMRTKADAKTIREYLKLPENDLLHCNFEIPGAFRPVFFVARDRQLEAVVVSVRGTMHANDALTDLVCDYVEWRGGHVHSGILAAAQWVLSQIDSILIDSIRKVTNIYLVGHSLGGGTVILMTMLLLQDIRFKTVNIRCAAFGPPPIVSHHLCNEPRIDVFVNGDDGVPRLCYGSAVDLQSLMLYCAQVSSDAWLFGDIPDKLAANLDTCRRIIATRSRSIKLLHPGRLHYLTTVDGSMRVFCVEPEFFNELCVTKRIIFDHLPDQYERAMDAAYVGYLMRDLEARRTNGDDCNRAQRLQIDLAGDTRSTPSPPPTPSRSNSI